MPWRLSNGYAEVGQVGAGRAVWIPASCLRTGRLRGNDEGGAALVTFRPG